MDEQEIENRILVCEKCERDYREVGNTRRADSFSNEKYKWEKLLDKLNPKRDKGLAYYKKGYGLLEHALNEIKEYINNHKRNLINPITHEEYEILDDENINNISQIIDKVLGEDNEVTK